MNCFKLIVSLLVLFVVSSCLNDDPPRCEELLWYADNDGDSLGNPNDSISSCVQPAGYVANGDDSNDDDALNLLPIVEGTVSNLHAPTDGFVGGTFAGPFTKFEFETGEITTSETDWDIAFRATTLIINGGEDAGGNDEPVRNGNSAS